MSEDDVQFVVYSAVGMVAKIDPIVIKMNYEHDDYMWVDANDLPLDKMHEGTIEQVRNCLAALKRSF